MKTRRTAVLLLGLLTACSSAQRPRCDATAQIGTGSNIYSLAAGDQLQIVVFRQPDLSGQFALDGEGYLALPLLGEIAADGLTTRQLEDELEIRLKAADFLISPQVGVQLATYRSFYVLGEVGTPGSYEYRDGLTVINAVALAGGYTARADRSGVTIGRGECGFDTLVDGLVNPGDVVTVAERFF